MASQIARSLGGHQSRSRQRYPSARSAVALFLDGVGSFAPIVGIAWNLNSKEMAPNGE